MNVRVLLRPVRGLWPQKVRTRLTLSYAALFFVAGSGLLGLTYGLVASSLPTRPPSSLTISSQELNLLEHACKSAGVALKDKHQVPIQKPLPVCKQAAGAYYAGTAAGMQEQRQNTLAKLLSISLLGLGVITVASGGIGWFMSGRVLRPVRVITETARRASERHLGERLALTGARDELKELADTFDDMLERLDAAFATCAEDAIDAAAPEIERLDLHLDTRLDPAETTGDPQLLERMISNLVDNAVRHNEPGGWIRLRTGSSQPAGGLDISVVIPRDLRRS